MAQGQLATAAVGTDPAWNVAGIARGCTLCSFDASATPWVCLICRGALTAVGREISGLLLGLSQLSWSSFQVFFMQEVGEGSGGCYISQGPGSGGFDYSDSISCPHKAGLGVLVLTEGNKVFLTVKKKEMLSC